MKQLLLNFLFFVGAAFILVQCAKLFPSGDKFSKRLSQGRANIDHKTNGKGAITPATATYVVVFKPLFKNPFFTNSSLPYNMMVYINHHSLLYDPYINFSYYDLARKYEGKSRHDK